MRNVRASGPVRNVPRGSASQHKTTAAPEMEAAFLLSVQFVGTSGSVQNVSETQASCEMFPAGGPVHFLSARANYSDRLAPCELFHESGPVQIVKRPPIPCRQSGYSMLRAICQAMPAGFRANCSGNPGSVRFVPVSRTRAICAVRDPYEIFPFRSGNFPVSADIIRCIRDRALYVLPCDFFRVFSVERVFWRDHDFLDVTVPEMIL